MKTKDFLGPEFKKQLAQILKHIDESIDKLYYIATHDEKTGLYNYAFFKNIASIEIEKAKRGKPLSLILADIDFFKKLNDKYGHVVGDIILEKVAGVLAKHVRKSDIVTRYGGEEFLVLLPNTTLARAVKVAERLRKKIKSYGGLKKYAITMSFGVAEFKKRDTLTRLIKRADKALYKAKKRGRDCVVAS